MRATCCRCGECWWCPLVEWLTVTTSRVTLHEHGGWATLFSCSWWICTTLMFLWKWKEGERQGGCGACAALPAPPAGLVPPGQPILSLCFCSPSQQQSFLLWLVLQQLCSSAQPCTPNLSCLQNHLGTIGTPSTDLWFPQVSWSACSGKSLSTLEFLVAQDACWTVGSDWGISEC